MSYTVKNMDRQQTCDEYRANQRAWNDDDGDSLTGRLVECNYCSEIALPFEGGECRECGHPQYF